MNAFMIRCVAAVLCLGTFALAQQAGAIRGTVFDKDFDAPLAAVKVLLVETGATVETTDQGNFRFADVAAGRYTLVFSKDGYVREVPPPVVVTAGQLTDMEVRMAGDYTDLEEFVVQDILQLGGGSEAALLQLRLESPSMMDSISAELMSRSGASDAASALRLVAGASLKDGKSAVIRGLPDRYVSSQLNGLRLPTADNDKRAVELDQFPASVIESVRVNKTFTPDQQGDASGGAVDVRLKGVPDEPFFANFQFERGYNSQVGRRGDFLTSDGGGLTNLGKDDGRRDQQFDNLGGNWEGAVGIAEGDAPIDYKLRGSLGGKFEIARGVRVGGFGSLFYERDSSFYNNGIDDQWWVENPGDPMTPATQQGTAQDGDFKTQFFDVTQANRSVQWGGLGAFGIETDAHELNFAYLYSRNAADEATLAEDTRGKEYFFPGYDPNDPNSPGYGEEDAAPYVRLETLEYTERRTDSLQVSGRHEFEVAKFGPFGAPEIDWVLAKSSALQDRPDKRQFGSLWVPQRDVVGITIPPTHRAYKPSANFTLGNLQRIWERIEEESDQYAVNLKLPFVQWGREKGYLKFGVFSDAVRRTFDQDTYSNFGDNSAYAGDWDDLWSRNFPFEDHPITESTLDVDYTGTQDIRAQYAMVDLPLGFDLKFVGGARIESTDISIVNDPEEDATWYPPGSSAPVILNPGDGDVAFSDEQVLPAAAFVWTPTDRWTFRASYTETVARQTFKELSPILRQEYLGGPIFIGNPDLRMSSLKNYDLRADYAPYEGGLWSVSWFHKDLKDPIEYVQRIAAFNFTSAVNYPKGTITGWEFEVRQDIGRVWEPLEGLAVGANATLIDSSVTLPEDEQAGFRLPNILAPMESREMTSAPEHLYNLYLTHDIVQTGTQLALFYTVTGDTLIAGAGQADGNYIPNVYQKSYGQLNFSLSQRLGDYLRLQIKAKNLTNPDIQTVYRSEYIGGDVLKTSYSQGIDYSISLGAEFRF
ncbi:MAG: TonB-dependent receptor domain-containing protein [Planctomycetota bacterium]